MFPDSALLIMIGLIIGIFFNLIGVNKVRKIIKMVTITMQKFQNEYFLGSETFMLFLLPPLVFDAGLFRPLSSYYFELQDISCRLDPFLTISDQF